MKQANESNSNEGPDNFIIKYKPVNESEFKIDDIYYKFIDLAQNTEENRWGRFNALLVVDTVLLAVWGSLIDSTVLGDFNQWLLAFVCIPGLLLSLIWKELGARTSRYHKYYIDHAKAIEDSFPIKGNIPMIMTHADKKAKRNRLYDVTSSTFIVTYVPLFFALIFSILLIASLH